jgi:RNA polymerase sigma factor (sigma-70 family)
MHPNVRREIKKGKPVDRLEFTGQTNIGALREIGFTSKRKAQRLDELYSQSPYPRGGPEDPKRLRTRQGISDGISKFKPDPDVIGFLFREHKFPGLIARKVAELKNIDEVRTACGQIQALGLSPSKQMDYLMLSPDELRQRLTGKRKDDSRSIPVFNDPRLKFFEAVIRDNPPPPPALERRLIREAKNGDAKASNELANRHLSVVIKTALVYDARLRRKGVNVDIMDLIQTGFLGLNQALDGFDVNHRDKGTKRPVRFSTYSGYRVDGAIKDYLLKEHKLRGISRQDYSDIGQYSKACDYFEAGGDREPSDEKVAARLGWDAERARKARLGFAISKKSVPLMDDIQQAGYSDFLERGLLEETMQEAFRCLAIPDVQRDILYMRFGCGTYNGKTHKLREIGENYQMSPSWARGQIEDLSERLRANRHRPEVKELLDYLGRGDSD